MTGPDRKEVDLLNAALELTLAAAREAYLDQACAGDPALRQRMRDLLKAHEEGGAFLETPALAGATARLETREVVPPSEKPGDRIGRYKLLQKLGEGGCGVVYMAEQEEPVRRRVALKVIKLGMDTRSVIARFEAERQALAIMDHPHIAKVLDAGATETGRPYFVMELVRGVRITDYCDQHNLDTEERLKLFLPVCHAIQHAHQKGIIHRDIKPSNVLVTLHDGVPVPKVIDFGIAKATEGRLTDKTLFTAFEQFIGTPAYMSPEQAEMSGLDIDTRSDIYSLGVLLYELLTGRPPFDPKELLNAGLDGMRRIIREQEPSRPSTRLSTLAAGELASVARHRHVEAPRLAGLVRGDLDWIVMKALEKDRTRRYETANGLAMDLQRHLNNEPVTASPPSRVYRFRKLVRRNKGLAAALTAIGVTLLAGMAISTWQAIRAERAERAARVEADRAGEQLKVNVAIAGFFTETMIHQASPFAAGEPELSVREALERGARSLDGQFTSEPLLEAALRVAISRVFQGLGRFDEGLAHAERALELRRRHLGPEDEMTLQAALEVANCRNELRDSHKAQSMTAEFLDLARRVLGEDHDMTRSFLRLIARHHVRNQRHDTAEPILVRLVDQARRLEGESAADGSIPMLAALYSRTGRHAEAYALVREYAAAVAKRHGGDEPITLYARLNLSEVALLLGRYEEAETILRDILPRMERRLGRDNPRIHGAAWTLVQAYAARGKWPECQAVQRDLLQRTKDLFGEYVSSVSLVAWHGRHAEAESLLDEFEARLSDLPETRTHWPFFLRAAVRFHRGDTNGVREVAQRMLRHFAHSHSNNPMRDDIVAKTCLLYPDVLEAGGVEQVFRMADAVFESIPDEDSWLGQEWFRLSSGLAAYRQGRYEVAIERLEPAGQADSRYCRAGCQVVLAMALRQAGRLDRAVAVLKQADETFRGLPEIGGPGFHGYVHDQFIALGLRREAGDLFRDSPSPVATVPGVPP